MSDSESNVGRLEHLWAGTFGDEYVGRNTDAARGRETFWNGLLDQFPVRSALEVGCNVGGNLEWIAPRIGARHTYGVDINETAIEEVRRRIPHVGALWSPARELPFRDCAFELTFTMGVLIHQPPESLPIVMSEVVRCSRRYVLCGEYFAEQPTEVPYRGQTGALFKRDFGAFYQQLFPELALRTRLFLPRGEGSWDDVTVWLFEKTW
jgi:pseudaminic acid biosynthesis-associated methylase